MGWRVGKRVELAAGMQFRYMGGGGGVLFLLDKREEEGVRRLKELMTEACNMQNAKSAQRNPNFGSPAATHPHMTWTFILTTPFSLHTHAAHIPATNEK